MVAVPQSGRGGAIEAADDERGDAEIAGPAGRVGHRDRVADPTVEPRERVGSQVPVGAPQGERRPQVEVAELAVLVDPQDETQALTGEVELAVVRADLDRHGRSRSVHDQW